MQQLLMNIYRKLYRAYGSRHWWPGETDFEVMVGAILIQNTSWRNVEKAIQKLKEKELLSPGRNPSPQEITVGLTDQIVGLLPNQGRSVKIFCGVPV